MPLFRSAQQESRLSHSTLTVRCTPLGAPEDACVPVARLGERNISQCWQSTGKRDLDRSASIWPGATTGSFPNFIRSVGGSSSASTSSRKREKGMPLTATGIPARRRGSNSGSQPSARLTACHTAKVASSSRAQTVGSPVWRPLRAASSGAIRARGRAVKMGSPEGDDSSGR